VPRNEDRNLRQDFLRKPVRRREVRDVFQRIDDKAGLLDSSATFVTLLEVGLEGLNPEANLVVEQEVDLVWKKVPVIH